MTKKASKSPPANVAEMSPFTWNVKTSEAALALAEGITQQEVAEGVGVSRRTIQRWLCDTEFSAEVDRLTLMVGIAGRAERIRIAKRVISQKTNGNLAVTEKDLLEWLKFAQSETDGAKLDLTKLAETLGG